MPDVSGEHLGAQLAACRSTAGITVAPVDGLLELRGGEPALGALGLELTGVRAGIGPTLPTRHGWWRRVASHRAILLSGGDGPSRAHMAALAASPDVATIDLTGRHSVVVLVGPLAGWLVRSSAAPSTRPLMVAGDGDDIRMLVVSHERASGAWSALMRAGRANGAIAISPQAARIHLTARRVLARQRRTTSHRPDPVTTGEPAA